MGPKKGRRKRDDDDWEDEVLGKLEDLKIGGENEEIEIAPVKGKGRKVKSRPQKLANENDSDERESEVYGESMETLAKRSGNNVDSSMDNDISSKPKGRKEKKKSKKDFSFDLLDEMDEDGTAVGDVDKAKTEEEVVQDAAPKVQKSGKKGKSDSAIKAVPATTDHTAPAEFKAGRESAASTLDQEDQSQPATTVKTAAQKKAEKKQREKERKKAQQQSKKEAKNDDIDSLLAEYGMSQPAAKQTPKYDTAPAAKVSEEGGETATDISQEKEKAGSSKSKKKKKKQTEAKEEAEDSDEPAKPTKMNPKIRAMQEALRRQRELEEQLKREAEEAMRAEEERIRQLEEAERLEKERREEKKRKEAERKARLKAEGKLLTKAQKEAQAKREAVLASLQAQGLDLPKVKEGERRKKVVYDNKRKKLAQNVANQQPATDLVSAAKPRTENDASVAVKEVESTERSSSSQVSDVSKEVPKPETNKVEKATESKDDNVIDSWEAAALLSDDEEEPATASLAASSEPKPIAANDMTDKNTESQSTAHTATAEIGGENKSKIQRMTEDVRSRIEENNKEAESARSSDRLRSPICCVLGHVDTGKTKILDHIRHTNVQTGEAGGITQQIGATYVPTSVLKDRTIGVNPTGKLAINVPGLLIIDTPGHESFSNLRSRGSSLCDISVLVVDIMHGLEPQTLESINLLRTGKTPFVVALNKIDRLYDWKATPDSPFRKSLKNQKPHVQREFEERVQQTELQLAEQGLNAKLYYENPDPRKYVSLVPTSAHTGEGLPDLLMLLVQLTQKLMANRIAFVNKVECSVLEVKMVQGLGTTIDVILSQGVLKAGDTIVVSGLEGPIVTTVRALLMPQPLKELRVKNAYKGFDEVYAAQGVKISAKHLEDAVAGTQLYVAKNPDEIDYYKELVERDLEQALASVRTDDKGVSAQASTLGALEALLVFLRDSKVPVANVNIGPVNRRDVVKCSTMMTHNEEYGVILAFDVKVSKDAAELAKDMGVIIFTADIIYHLFDRFTEHMATYRERKRQEVRHLAWFPCQLAIKPEFIFNTRDPIVLGVDVVEGRLVPGVPIVVPTKEFLEIGVVESVEINNKQIAEAKVGQAVCVKIRNTHDAPRMFGRHFDETDKLYTNLKRETIDILKEHFRDDMSKEDWRLVMKMKKIFGII